MKRLVIGILSTFVLSANLANASVLPFKNRNQQQLEAFRDGLLSKGKIPQPKPSAPDTHVLFDTAQAAVDWATEVAPRLKLSSGASRFDVLPVSDPRVAVLQSHVNELWNAYAELFPEETAGLNVPPVVLIDSEVINAFVPRHIIQDDKIAHTVIVLTELLDVAGGAENRDLLSGMFGHELAHSVFRHGLDQYRARVNKYFKTTETRFGFQAVRNAELDAAINSWASAAGFVGDLTHEELSNLPSNGVARPILWRTWNQLMTELFDTTDACESAKASFATWSEFQVNSPFASSYSLNLTDPAAVVAASEGVMSDTTTCLGERRRPFIELFSAVVGIPADALAQMPEIKAIADEFDRSVNAIEGFRGLVAPMRASMLEVESSNPMGEIGFFTYEEHADDVSLKVHRHLGWDPMSLSNFFNTSLPLEDRTRCATMIADGITPPAGSFSDPHRATCFRIAHLKEFNELVATRDPRSFADYYVEQTIGR
jgi:hypothetical protein